MNLALIQTFVSIGIGESLFEYLVRENHFFIEWTVANIDLETELDKAFELADLQRLLSGWKLGWGDWWSDEQIS